MNTIDIKAHVTSGNCTFVRAEGTNLWYRTALGFDFPVPVEDMGDATFETEIRGMMMMRYVRKHAANAATEYKFVKARAGNLWYRDAAGFEFPVPFTEMINEAFGATERGEGMAIYAEAHATLIHEQRQQLTAV